MQQATTSDVVGVVQGAIEYFENLVLNLQTAQTEEEYDAAQEALDAYLSDSSDKLYLVGSMYQELDIRINGIAEELVRLVKRKQEFQLRQERLQDAVKRYLTAMNMTKLETDLFTYKITKGESVVINDEPDESSFEAYPEYVKKKVTFAWDRMAIKKRLKDNPISDPNMPDAQLITETYGKIL